MKISPKMIAATLTAAAVVAVVFAYIGRSSSGPATAPGKLSNEAVNIGRVIPIDVVALQRLMTVDPNLVIIDVRKTEERSGPLGYIPQSLLIPEKTVLEHPENLPSGKTLVFICYSGPRSLRVARKAASRGITSYYVKGGMVAWGQLERSKDKKNPPESPLPKIPEEPPTETPFFGKDMGC